MVERLHGLAAEDGQRYAPGRPSLRLSELYELLGMFGWDFVIRFRESSSLPSRAGRRRSRCRELVPATRPGQRCWSDAAVTDKRAHVGAAVVLVKRKGMKEAWCLATSLATADADEIVRAYSKRFTIEETFRDQKDITFGVGLRATHIRDAARRDRLLLLIAIAYTLLTLLGAASEESKLDKTLKTNTSPEANAFALQPGALLVLVP